MGRFIAGLIVGIIVGVLAMVVNPNLPHELRVSLANLTALVMQNAEEAADSVGEAAEEAGRTADDTGDRATTPDTPATGRGTGEPVEDTETEPAPAGTQPQ